MVNRVAPKDCSPAAADAERVAAAPNWEGNLGKKDDAGLYFAMARNDPRQFTKRFLYRVPLDTPVKGLRLAAARNEPVSASHSILAAAERVGEDGLGRDGVAGYLYRLALKDRKSFTKLISLLVREATSKKAYHRESQSSFGDAVLATAARLGGDGIGKEGLAGYFKRFAIREPTTFMKLFLRLAFDTASEPE